MPMREIDVVVLTRNLDQIGLREGDVGTIIHRYADGLAYEVEFVTAAGMTAAVVTLNASDVCQVGGSGILHVRPMTGAA